MSSLPFDTDDGWPTADLDPLARLRVMAAGLPGTVVHERVLDVAFDQVWDFVEDLPRSVPTFERLVDRLTVEERDGSKLKVSTRCGWRGVYLPVNFDVELERGWCLMVQRPRFYVVGMAAVPVGEQTRWGQLEGLASGVRGMAPLLRLARFRHHRHVDHDINGLEVALRNISSPPV